MKEILRIATGIAQGLKFIHSKKVFHRDMKSMNVLLDDNFHAKISDFGMAKEKLASTVMTQSTVGTFAWMAPEVMKGEPYNETVDIYGFGMVLWEMVTNQIPFSGMNQMALFNAFVNKKQRPPLPPLSQQFPKELKSLIEGCWDHESTMRTCLDKILGTLLQIETSLEEPKNSDTNIIQLTEVDQMSPEFDRLLDSFNASMQQHHWDYVISRIENKSKPISFLFSNFIGVLFDKPLNCVQIVLSGED